MERVSIDIPAEELAWAQSRVDAGEAENLGAYFRDLAARDREEAAQVAELEALLDEGLNSGIDPRSVEQIFADVRAAHNL